MREKWPRGKNENKSKIYAEKNQKTITQGKRTAKTELIKKQRNEKS